MSCVHVCPGQVPLSALVLRLLLGDRATQRVATCWWCPGWRWRRGPCGDRRRGRPGRARGSGRRGRRSLDRRSCPRLALSGLAAGPLAARGAESLEILVPHPQVCTSPPYLIFFPTSFQILVLTELTHMSLICGGMCKNSVRLQCLNFVIYYSRYPLP